MTSIAEDLARALRDVPVVDWAGQPDPVALRAARSSLALHQTARTEVAEVTDQMVPADPAVPVRLYRPEVGARLPAVVFFHGGGFVLGNLETQDRLARTIARRCHALVISVDYRLAPEHPFPAAPQDSLAAYRWVLNHADEIGCDPARVAVAGEAAGGNLAAAVCLMARDRGLPLPIRQVLWYPATDFVDTESRRTNADAPLLTRAALEWLDQQYLAGAEPTPYAAPARAATHAGLPPAYIVVAEHDPLLDDGLRYARLLAAAGVPVHLDRRQDMVHGFLSLIDWVPSCRQAAEGSLAFLRQSLSNSLDSRK